MSSNIICIFIQFFETLVYILGQKSPHLGFLCGLPVSLDHNVAHLFHIVNILTAASAITFVYCFNTWYLKQKHAALIIHECPVRSSKGNLLSLKKLLLGIILILILIIAVILIQTLGQGKHNSILQRLLTCCVLTVLNIYYAQNENVFEMVENAIQKMKARFEFTAIYSTASLFVRNRKVTPGLA